MQNHASKERAGGRKSNLGHDQIIVSEIVCISICERAGFKCAVCVCRGGGEREFHNWLRADFSSLFFWIY